MPISFRPKSGVTGVSRLLMTLLPSERYQPNFTKLCHYPPERVILHLSQTESRHWHNETP